MRILDSLPGATSMAVRAINDRTQIVGIAQFPETPRNRAFLWEDGTVQDLGTLPGAIDSNAQAINFFATIVGYSTLPSGTTAIVWRDGEMRDLNEMIADDDPLKSSVHLTGASDINDFGWITAGGIDPTQTSFPPRQTGYVLIPVWKHRH